jgi:Flp pilus assembly protein TadD
MRLCYFVVAGLFAIVGFGVAAGRVCAASPSTDGIPRRCEFGIAQALGGNLASAESAFVDILAESPTDAPALNNLGNLHLLRGEPDLAMACYGLAGDSDTSDAGILLNRGTSLLLMGFADSAGVVMAVAVDRAGGAAGAAALLGIHLREAAPPGPKAADQPRVSREEMKALLVEAARKVPRSAPAQPDSSRRGDPAHARRQASMRAGGLRAGQETGLSNILYWKR